MQLQINKLSQFKLNLPVFTKPLISNRNRLEGLPRTDEFNRSLRAEIADPLWLLCRQWQVGEFEGEDAATACQAKILAEHQQPQVIHFNQGNPAEYDANKMPLETLIEGELPRHDYYLSVQMGRQFFKLMNSAGLSTHKKAFITQYPIAAIQDAEDIDAMYLFQST